MQDRFSLCRRIRAERISRPSAKLQIRLGRPETGNAGGNAGESAGIIQEIKPARSIVHEIVRDARERIRSLARLDL